MIIIPAFQPDQKLEDLLNEINKKFNILKVKILIVNDGSSSNISLKILKKIEKIDNVIIIKHDTNLGKGAALKTGIKYAKRHKNPFIITADADGQHLAQDIHKLWLKGNDNHNKFLMGVRNFDSNTPLRSFIGNKLTSIFFKIVTGKTLQDTQSGLRLIPENLYDELLEIKSNKYDFELDCLLKIAKLSKKNIETVEISTIYEVGNLSSHFRPILDSSLVYLVFLRFSFSAISIAFLDFICFLFLSLMMNTSLAFLIARSFSVLIYFIAMKKIVFKAKQVSLSQKLGFILLVLLNIIIIYLLVGFLNDKSLSLKGFLYVSINIASALINFFLMKAYLFINKK